MACAIMQLNTNCIKLALFGEKLKIYSFLVIRALIIKTLLLLDLMILLNLINRPCYKEKIFRVKSLNSVSSYCSAT